MIMEPTKTFDVIRNEDFNGTIYASMEGVALAGYSATAIIIDSNQDESVTTSVSLTQGAGLTWGFTIPAAQTNLIDAEDRSALLQVDWVGPITKRVWYLLKVSPTI